MKPRHGPGPIDAAVAIAYALGWLLLVGWPDWSAWSHWPPVSLALIVLTIALAIWLSAASIPWPSRAPGLVEALVGVGALTVLVALAPRWPHELWFWLHALALPALVAGARRRRWLATGGLALLLMAINLALVGRTLRRASVRVCPACLHQERVGWSLRDGRWVEPQGPLFGHVGHDDVPLDCLPADTGIDDRLEILSWMGAVERRHGAPNRLGADDARLTAAFLRHGPQAPRAELLALARQHGQRLDAALLARQQAILWGWDGLTPAEHAAFSALLEARRRAAR